MTAALGEDRPKTTAASAALALFGLSAVLLALAALGFQFARDDAADTLAVLAGIVGMMLLVWTMIVSAFALAQLIRQTIGGLRPAAIQLVFAAILILAIGAVVWA